MIQNTILTKVQNKKLYIAILIAVLVVSGVLAYTLSGHKPTWLVKMELWSYLKKQSGKSDFTVNFKFPPKSEMEKTPPKQKTVDEKSLKGKRTNKDFDQLRVEYMNLKTEAFLIERDINIQKTLKEVAQNRMNGSTNAEILLTYVREQMAQPMPFFGPPDQPPATNAQLQSNIPQVPTAPDALKSFIENCDKIVSEKSKELAAKEEAIKPILEDLIEFQVLFKSLYQPIDFGGSGELANAQNELIRSLRSKFDEAQTYGKMYEYIGQELWVADRLFEAKNPEILRAALNMARQAARDAIDQAQNSWLAARIYEAYILPNIEIAGTSTQGRRTRFSMEGLINECANVFQNNEETDNVIRCYKMLLALAPDSPRADFTRVQLASIYEQAGNESKAIAYLKEIKSTNTLNWALRRFPSLESAVRGSSR